MKKLTVEFEDKFLEKLEEEAYLQHRTPMNQVLWLIDKGVELTEIRRKQEGRCEICKKFHV